MALKFNPFTGTLDQVSDPATTTAQGVTKLAGDLAGTADLPVVAKINGTAVTGTPSLGKTIVATSGSAATWQTPSATTQRAFAYWIRG